MCYSDVVALLEGEFTAGDVALGMMVLGEGLAVAMKDGPIGVVKDGELTNGINRVSRSSPVC